MRPVHHCFSSYGLKDSTCCPKVPAEKKKTPREKVASIIVIKALEAVLSCVHPPSRGFEAILVPIIHLLGAASNPGFCAWETCGYSHVYPQD